MLVTKCFVKHSEKTNDLTAILTCIRAYSRRRGHDCNFINKKKHNSKKHCTNLSLFLPISQNYNSNPKMPMESEPSLVFGESILGS